MRSAATSLVVGALLVIALLAAVDGLQRSLRPEPQRAADTNPPSAERSFPGRVQPPQIANRAAVRAKLEAAGVRGRLHLLDGACRPWRLDLPTLLWTRVPGGPAPRCRIVLSPRGRILLGDGAWHPVRELAARELRGRVQVLSRRSGASVSFPGSDPGFRPDGRLTFIRDGELWAWRTDCGQGAPRCGRLLLSEADLRRALEDVLLLDEYILVDAVWLGPGTLGVHVRDRLERWSIAARLERGRATTHFTATGPRLGKLEASPRGTFLAVRAGGTTVLLSAGRTQVLDGRVHAIAWPADETFTLLAAPASVWLRRPGDPPLQIPVTAADLGWTG